MFYIIREYVWKFYFTLPPPYQSTPTQFLINAPTHTDALGTALFALYATTTTFYALPVAYLCYYYRVGRLSKRSLCFLYFEVDLER